MKIVVYGVGYVFRGNLILLWEILKINVYI